MRTISLNARAAHDSAHSGEIEVLLLQFEHPALAAPFRVSSDPTERLSTDPQIYCTRSGWNGADPATEPYLFMAIEAEVPGDRDDTQPTARMTLSRAGTGLVDALRSVTSPATAHMAVVMASSPDLVEVEFRDLRLVVTEFDDDAVEITLAARSLEAEAFPSPRMTKHRFPGLFA